MTDNPKDKPPPAPEIDALTDPDSSAPTLDQLMAAPPSLIDEQRPVQPPAS
jgi:hypothetical protein